MLTIELKGVSKKYRRHTQRPLGTLKSYLLHDLWHRRANHKQEFIWALRDLNLEIEKGRTLGVIGRNGSGKSTLLKIISRILKPDAGTLNVHGKVAALIELGAGFHPELTGRENIIFNGIILGLSKSEIKAKLDEIVDFAELREYIDDPVRTYSSGMYVRLGFSVAVHTDPEILLTDEILAVGDAPFKKKCMDRMEYFKRSGRTIVIVTHDMEVVKSWCDEAILLDHGFLKKKGDPTEVVSAYTEAMQ